MDLGIRGRKAIICASSQGLGHACASALAREGVEVVLNGRDAKKLEIARTAIRNLYPDASIKFVAADINTGAGRDALVSACPDADILINNNGGPLPGGIEGWDHDAWLQAFESNMIAPVLLIRALLPQMRNRKFGRIINITSAMVKSPRYVMGLSTGARAALTAVSKAISQEAVADNVTLNNLLPERIDTPRQEFMVQRTMKEQGISHAEARDQIASTVAAKRFGLPGEFADACAFLCSAQAGFISGQNLQIDGGSYGGLI